LNNPNAIKGKDLMLCPARAVRSRRNRKPHAEKGQTRKRLRFFRETDTQNSSLIKIMAEKREGRERKRL